MCWKTRLATVQLAPSTGTFPALSIHMHESTLHHCSKGAARVARHGFKILGRPFASSVLQADHIGMGLTPPRPGGHGH